MKKTRLVAYSGIMTALSVVLLFLGSISVSLGYAVPIFTGLLMIFLIESVSVNSAVITYFAVSLLSLLLLNNKETALFYVLFFGYYPILRIYIQKIKLKPVRIILKLFLFNVSMTAVQLILVYILNIPFDNIFGKLGIILFALALNFIFVLYDITYDKLLIIYDRKFRRKIERFFK